MLASVGDWGKGMPGQMVCCSTRSDPVYWIWGDWESGENERIDYLIVCRSLPVVEQGVSTRDGAWNTAIKCVGENQGRYSLWDPWGHQWGKGRTQLIFCYRARDNTEIWVWEIKVEKVLSKAAWSSVRCQFIFFLGMCLFICELHTLVQVPF